MNPAAIASWHLGSVSVIARAVSTRVWAPAVVMPNVAATKFAPPSMVSRPNGSVLSGPAGGVGPASRAVSATARSAIHACWRSHNVNATDAECSSRASISSNDKYRIIKAPGSTSNRSSLHHPGPASGNNDAATARSHSSINTSTSASAINMQASYLRPPTLSDRPVTSRKLWTSQRHVHKRRA